ncbi:hypothetical protein [uncultured Winogradskyella sp.]|uniref:hypothetical protein n=1 Tax=uncultured Winogradskyella sp. TaxID=395353 RepID=UPI0030D6E230
MCNNELILSINVLNEGFGPAVIKSIKFRIDDTSIDAIEFDEMIKEKFGSNNQIKQASVLHTFSIIPLSAGKEMNVINCHFRTNIIKSSLEEFLKTVRIQIKYQNIYKEKKAYKEYIIA